MDVSCSKLNLLYLTNQTFQHRYNKCENKSKLFQIVGKEDLNFYRKRIFQTCKDVLRGNCNNDTLVKSFENFAAKCIENYKFEDKKEFYQKEYNDIVITKKMADISFNQSEVNKFMMKSEKPQEPKTIKDFLNVTTSYKEKRRKIPIPKRKEMDLKNKKFRTKGVESKK
tara:strand:+ start:2459 stop:2965 length:507 start_codon:yes stop_codon:yes gene_type:complete